MIKSFLLILWLKERRRLEKVAIEAAEKAANNEAVTKEDINWLDNLNKLIFLRPKVPKARKEC